MRPSIQTVRSLIGTTALAITGLALLTAATNAMTQTIKQPGIVLQAKTWNDIQVQDETGKTLLTLSGLEVKPKPRIKTTAGAIKEITTPDGLPAIEVDYTLTGSDNTPSELKLTGLFAPKPGRVDVTYILSNVPPDAKISDSMFGRRLANGAVELPAGKLGLWKRHAHGGQPQEHPDGKIALYQIGDQILGLAFDSTNRVNLGWKDARAHHIGFIKSPDAAHPPATPATPAVPPPPPAVPATYTANFSVIISPSDWPVEFVSARWHGRPVGLKLGTDKLYNWWTSTPGQPADKQPALTLKNTLANTSLTSRTVTLKHWVRDFAGNYVSRQTRDLELAAGQTLTEDIKFQPSPDSIDPTRDIFFAEVSIADKTTGEELAFARTNLALLPPHEFKGTSAESIFGIAAYWPFPDETSVQSLMERMGVRWYRQGNTHDYKNITALRHTQIPKKTYDEDTAAGDKWIREQLQLCVDHANPAWEFGNEINYAVMSIGMGDTVKDQERAKRVAKYLGWVKAIRRIQKEMGAPAADVKLLSVGLAGMDVKFADAIQDAGGWKLLDGLAVHPGRGNFTPDYPVSEPWQNWTHGAYGNYWNYYGSVRTAAELVKKYGDTPQKPKELWLTEVYACAYPNSFWEDSLRHGTENAILSFGLAMSANVKALMWYQLFDTVWFDKLGVNPKDREYYFGLINRDLSLKPALLAYAAAAEELDQAKFVRWLKFPKSANGEESKTRGLLFDTPRGPMTILWDRTDGYVLSEKQKDFASPEAWTDEWRSRVSTTLPLAHGQTTLTAINSIGQRKQVPADAANKSTVTLKLTGAPVIVYGLDVTKLK
ncbi:hypothetical protein [Geminisphaera colitermitum]|uniref:hypothetical protein n=1 Tax=Geminisphaera colitermitum TaxID=1148786 RepID=UPI0001964D75|nr:hypothetical protein [Geminisphaera colitermitum]